MRPTALQMVNNIATVFEQSFESEREDGRLWYPRAHKIVCDWAETFERSIANVACVVAALSPQCEWERNLIIADDILRGDQPSIGGAIHSFVRIAERVRDDRAWGLRPYFKQGCKVQSFAANLAGNYDIVTVDTHACEIAVGSLDGRVRVDKWQTYGPVALAYVDAAHALDCDLKPAELQAITWLTWKRLHPRTEKIQHRSKQTRAKRRVGR